MAILRAIKGMNPGQLFVLDRDRSVMGRHPGCDIVLEAAAVSRQHAEIVRLGSEFYLEDCGSRNGTYLNARVLTGRQKLTEGDRIQICDLLFMFHQAAANIPGAMEQHQQDMETGAVLVDDQPSTGATVMSKLDVSRGSAGLPLQANAEAKLKALMEISKALGKAVGLEGVLGKLLDSLFAVFPQADRGFVVLRDPRTGKSVPTAFRLRRPNDAQPIRISRTIVNNVMETREAVLSADALNDSRFDTADSIVDFHIRSIMCVPLVASDGRAMGVIQIDTVNQRSRFSSGDLEVLASVACQASFAVENAQLHEAALRERAIERELAVAHEVQQGFLPAAAPMLAGYDFFEFYEPANKLGGDYFDYIPLAGGRLAIVVADVSGKGIAASLLMARLSAETRYCLVSEPSLTDAVSKLNRVFCDPSWEDRFVTFVAIVLDPLRHELTVVNAGHMAPLLRCRDGRVTPLAEEETRMPLGVMEDVAYVASRYPIDRGDSLILYTDGITEAMNEAGQLYGHERLYGRLADQVDGVRHLGLRILDDVKQFVGGHVQTDDMCLTCLGRALGA